MNSINSSISLSEDEKIVRDFRCTKLRRFLFPSSIGYLSVTNKRLIYHCEGKTITGTNVILAEMPLEDAAGISTSIGKGFNWLILIVFCVILYFATGLLVNVLPNFLTGWVISSLLILPYSLAFLFEKEILNKEIKDKALQQLQNSAVGEFIKKKDSNYFLGIFQILFVIGLVFLSWNIGMRTDLKYNAVFVSYVVIFGSYLLIYFILIGQQKGFYLEVNSRTSVGTGINISTNLLNGGLLTGVPQPAEDAEIVVNELGAIVTDIQQMGDLGVEKWKQ